MRNFIELNKSAGNRQKRLLFELERQCIICLNKESGLWMRGPLNCKLAKDLLLPSDKTIEEQIKNLEPHVLRLEKEANQLNISLSGGARTRLNALYGQKAQIYNTIN